MEIIKHGNPDICKRIKMFKCPNCGCIFKADKHEYKSNAHLNEFFYSCNCPECAAYAYETLTTEEKKLIEKVADAVEMILINEGQHDLQFKLGEIIKYDPTAVKALLIKNDAKILDVLQECNVIGE